MEPSTPEFQSSEFVHFGILSDSDIHFYEAAGYKAGVAQPIEHTHHVLHRQIAAGSSDIQDISCAGSHELNGNLSPGTFDTDKVQIQESGSRKQANREHQRRFRQREKVRAHAAKTQLASTLAQLQRLELQKQNLEQRLQQSQRATIPAADNADSLHPDNDLDNMPVMAISINSQECQMTAEEVISMSEPQFATLWKGYTVELGTHLDLVKRHRTTDVQNRLHQLTFEAILLRDCRLKAKINEARWLTDKPSSFFAEMLMVLQLSEGQIQDLMLLRRLCVAKTHLLSSRRASLMAKLQENSPDDFAEAVKESLVATQIADNAAQHPQLVHRMTWAILCGVLNMRQAAEVLVRAGPNKFVVPALLRYLADQRGFPTAQQIVDGADETAIADDWSLFCQYTGAVNPYISMHEGYIPIHRHQQSAASVQPFLY